MVKSSRQEDFIDLLDSLIKTFMNALYDNTDYDFKSKINLNGKSIIYIEDITLVNPDLTRYFFDNPKEFIYLFEDVFSDVFLKQIDSKIPIINYIPDNAMNFETQILDINALNVTHENKMWIMEGIVISISDARTYKKIILTCPACKKRIKVNDYVKSCPNSLCKMYVDKNDFITDSKTYQFITIFQTKNLETTNKRIKCRAKTTEHREDNLIDWDNLLGRKVIMVGYLYPVKIYDKRTNEVSWEYEFEVVGFKPNEAQILTNDEKTEIVEFINQKKANQCDMLDYITDQILGDFYGHEYAKKAMILTTLGLKNEHQPNSKKRNNQMCCILISNPAKGKSSMAKELFKYLPNCNYAGQNISKAGLTAGIDKDSGENIVSLGLVPLSNNGAIAIDEFNLIKDELESLLVAISDGHIKLAKIKKISMDIFVNFILLGNPKNNVFDPTFSYMAQINLPPALLSRADFIVVMNDPKKGNAMNDMQEYAKTILCGKPNCKDDKPKNVAFLKKLLYYLKHEAKNPTINNETFDLISNLWSQINTQALEQKKIESGQYVAEKLDERTLITIMKVSIVVARINLCDEVNESHVYRAWDILYNSTYKYILENVKFGTISAFKFQIQQKQNIKQLTTSTEVFEFIENTISIKFKKEIDHDTLLDKMIERGLSKDSANKFIQDALSRGIIIESRIKNGNPIYTPKDALMHKTEQVMDNDNETKDITEFLIKTISSNNQINYIDLVAIALDNNFETGKTEQILDSLLRTGTIFEINSFLKLA